MPYWGFRDLFHKVASKLSKTVYAVARTKKVDGVEYFRFVTFLLCEGLSEGRILGAIERGDLLSDFDARTGHNHGTKFRLRQNSFPSLFDSIRDISLRSGRPE